ncbi:MAG TPA: right-handed parallel beta-helix repeat-containing protein, partial [Candidatus Anammoximicrobium sp.]|nr:right-handed parallel beta-helix repeat-containing protein [Candidatus Anammoximicrobium sp.]
GPYGGGIYAYGALTVTNSTFSGNAATTSGGGVYHSSGSLTVTNSTLVANMGGMFGAIHDSSAPTIVNSILWRNSGDEISGAEASLHGSNLIGVDAGFVRNPSDGGDGWRDDPATTEVDEATNNDYGDLRLTDRSPAISFGDNSLVPLDTQDLDGDGDTAETVPFDRDGQSRIFGTTVDCGAFEFQGEISPDRETPSLVVTTVADAVDLVDGEISLREAIYYAGTGDLGTIVTFDPMLAGQTIKLDGAVLWVNKSLTIDASALTSLTLDADGKSRVVRVTNGTVVLDSLTVTGGHGDKGGAIYNAGWLTVRNSAFVANVADNTGGAVYSGSGALTVTNTTFSKNQAGDSGGGIYSRNALSMTNSALLGNWAGNYGGGIYSADQVAITGASIVGNFASSSGGGMYLSAGGTVTNSTLTANAADSVGGIYSNSPLMLGNSILWENGGADLGRPAKLVGSWNLIGLDPGWVRDPLDGGDGWQDDPSTPSVDESANNDYGDLHLTDHSIAIGYGNRGLLPTDSEDLDGDLDTAEPIPWDPDGQPRVYGASVDCGAYEFQGEPAAGRETPSVVVTTASDTFDLTDGQISLREAVYYAGMGDLGTAVNFAPALDGATLKLNGTMIWLDKPLSIDASALQSLTIDGDGKSRVFRVTASDVVLDSLDITGGRADFGGAIYSSGSLTLRNSTLSGNTATSSGGSIYNASGTLELVSTTVANNSASGSGGGIYSSGTATFTQATFSTNAASGSGGGVYSSNRLTVTDSDFSGNTANSSGGGIFSSGTLIVSGGTYSDNKAQGSYGQGGAIFSSGTATISNSALTNNAVPGYYGYGGGVYGSGSLSIADSTLFGNSASYYGHGGGIYFSSGTLSIANTTLSGNSASYYGGGIYSSGTLAVAGSAISGNSGYYGGGIYAYSGTVTVTQSTLSSNTGSYYGGGIYSDSGTLTATNVEFLGNWAGTYGGGIYSASTVSVTNSAFSGNSANSTGGAIYGYSGSLTVTNSTLVANSGGSAEAIYSAGTLTLRNSILWQNSGGEIGGGGSFTGTRDLFGMDPGFVRNPSDGGDGWRDNPSTSAVNEAANNDYGDLHLTERSPAVDYGDTSSLPLDAQDLDQDGDKSERIPWDLDPDGHARVVGSSVDCGAFEFQGEVPPGKEPPSVVVTTASDAFDLYDGHISLREAIYYAGIGSLGMTVTFDRALDGQTVTLGGNMLWLDKPLTIDASALSSLTVNADAKSRVFRTTANGVVLDSLTITGGRADYGGAIYSSASLTIKNSRLSGNAATGGGGGIYNASGTLVVMNSTLSGNTASGSGGAIYGSGTLTVTNSTLSGNSANSGGGVYAASGTLSMADTTVSGNTAAGSGGGIYASGTLSIVNTTFTGNSANSGGGVYVSGSGTLAVTNGILTGNVASGSGGGIYASSGSVTVTNSTLVANTGGSAGAIYTSATLNVRNSVFWQNSGAEIGGSGSFTGAWNLFGANPRFVRNASDGGDGWRDDPATSAVNEAANNDYGDLRLTDRSPAIDYGNNSLLPLDAQDLDHDTVTNEPIPFDRDGQTRVVGSAVDLGAYEFTGSAAGGRETPATVVTTPADSFDLYDGLISIREGTYYAGLQGLGTTITFDAMLAGAEVLLDGSSLYLDRTMSLDGSALSDTLTVNAAGHSRVLTLMGSQDQQFEVRGLTMTGGSADYGAGIYHPRGTLTVNGSTLSDNNASSSGGGIYSTGSLTIANSVFSRNSANTYGGGIYATGTSSVTDSTFSNNSAGSYGGGIYSSSTLSVTASTFSLNSAVSRGGGIYSTSTLSLTSSVFSGNRTSNGSGGGIYSYYGTPSVTNSIFSGNRSSNGSGGGIYSYYGTLSVVNSGLSGNTASSQGGGIYSYYGTQSVSNSTLSGNSAGSGGGMYNARGT